MDSPRNRGCAALLSLVMLLALAGPAAASPPVVLAKVKPWHWWLAPVLGLSFVGLLLMMILGYVVKVVMLKYGVKIGPPGRKAS